MLGTPEEFLRGHPHPPMAQAPTHAHAHAHRAPPAPPTLSSLHPYPVQDFPLHHHHHNHNHHSSMGFSSLAHQHPPPGSAAPPHTMRPFPGHSGAGFPSLFDGPVLEGAGDVEFRDRAPPYHHEDPRWKYRAKDLPMRASRNTSANRLLWKEELTQCFEEAVQKAIAASTPGIQEKVTPTQIHKMMLESGTLPEENLSIKVAHVKAKLRQYRSQRRMGLRQSPLSKRLASLEADDESVEFDDEWLPTKRSFKSSSAFDLADF